MPPTPADLDLARRLHARGRMDAEVLRQLLAELGGAPGGISLAQLLVQRRLIAPAELGPLLSAAPAGPWPGTAAGPAFPATAAGQLPPPTAAGQAMFPTGGGPLRPATAAWQDPAGPPRTVSSPSLGGVSLGASGELVLRPGGRIEGYEVVERLGAGGMGAVYRARSLETGQTVAIKTLRLAEADEAALERFRREGRAQAAVDGHPNVVRVRSAGEVQGQLYLIMDLVDGGDLERRLRQGPLEPAEAARIAAALARGLAHVHGRGILHRDLKPANVLFDGEGTPKLVDFGIARLDGDVEALTRTGTFVGTPNYMAPEQAEGRRQAIGPWSDIYGLGAVLYHALTGRPPYEGTSAMAVIKQVVTEDPPRPRALRREVPLALEGICLKALARAPEARYRSAEAFASDLERFLRGDLVVGLPRPRRGRGPLLAAVGVAAAAVLGGGVWLALLGPAPAAPPPPPPPPPAKTAASAPAPEQPRSAGPAVLSSFRWALRPGQTARYRLSGKETSQHGTTGELGGTLELRCLEPLPDGRARLEARLDLRGYSLSGDGPLGLDFSEVFASTPEHRLAIELLPDGTVAALGGLEPLWREGVYPALEGVLTRMQAAQPEAAPRHKAWYACPRRLVHEGGLQRLLTALLTLGAGRPAEADLPLGWAWGEPPLPLLVSDAFGGGKLELKAPVRRFEDGRLEEVELQQRITDGLEKRPITSSWRLTAAPQGS